VQCQSNLRLGGHVETIWERSTCLDYGSNLLVSEPLVGGDGTKDRKDRFIWEL
jgi:hypothetical protein